MDPPESYYSPTPGRGGWRVGALGESHLAPPPPPPLSIQFATPPLWSKGPALVCQTSLKFATNKPEHHNDACHAKECMA